MIKIILLDIGGVIVEIADKRLIELMGNRITPQELSRCWINSEYVTLFESGRCDTMIFAEGIIKEFNMNITTEDFIDEFKLLTKGFFPGATELLQKIKLNYTLACLSNTNVVQWNGLCERIAIDKYFDYTFLSYEIGKLKPELDIYKHVINVLNCNPDEIAFFDDNEANIKAGMDAGMNAYKVLGCKDLRDKLEILGLL